MEVFNYKETSDYRPHQLNILRLQKGRLSLTVTVHIGSRSATFIRCNL